MLARFLKDLKAGRAQKVYFSAERTIETIPPVRRDLIKRHLYLVPNSIVVSRGCPHHCDFCYKDAFFEGGKSFYTQRVDAALSEIDRLAGKPPVFPGRSFIRKPKICHRLICWNAGHEPVFQGASTIDAILRGNLIEKAAEAGLRSVFIGFETLNNANLSPEQQEAKHW
jgi:radical SAM superfamily enzyme YgiQ (UPF0313 family)